MIKRCQRGMGLGAMMRSGFDGWVELITFALNLGLDWLADNAFDEFSGSAVEACKFIDDLALGDDWVEVVGQWS